MLPARAHVPQRSQAGPGSGQPEGPSGNRDDQRWASVPVLGQGWRDGVGMEKEEEKTGSWGEEIGRAHV